MFVRFVVSERDPDSGHDRGVFTALYDLQKRGELLPHELLPHELTWFREAETWLNEHLAPPSRLSRSARPGAPGVAISWLKLSAVEHLRRMRDLVQLLEHKGVPVSELRTERPGYVVYEDDHQVAAIALRAGDFLVRTIRDRATRPGKSALCFFRSPELPVATVGRDR